MKTWLQFFIVSLLFFCFSPSVLFSGGSSFAVAADDGADSLEVAIIKVHSRQAKELLPQVQTMLSASGRASADNITGAVIVADTAARIKNIRRLIRQLDVDTPQVTITLRYHQANTGARSLSTGSGISGPGGGLHISSGDFHRQKNLQITVSSGSTGHLVVGRKIPFTSYWLDLCSRYGYRFGRLTDYRTVGSGFSVRPLVLGDRVDLTLIPRLSFADGREILFTRAATRVMVPKNTWVHLAATKSGMDAVSAAILSANGQNNSQAMVLETMVRIH